MLIYDLEIIKSIPPIDGKWIEGIEYCDGWHDHKNMGISVLCVYDFVEDRYRVFLQDNLSEFEKLCSQHDCLVSFNGIAFDNKVLSANGIDLPVGKCYDLLVKIWDGDNLSPMFEHPTHQGYRLNNICITNFRLNKSGNCADAPILWQNGKFGSVIDYCLNDVWLTKRLLHYIIINGEIISPKDINKTTKVQRPM